MMDAEAVPTRPTGRIEQLDLLRGFAIFGILVVNMTIFSGSAWNTETTIGIVDRLAYQAIELLAEGKFLNLFSFLFGVGFTLQLHRVTAHLNRFAPLYSRRLIGLFLIGLIHGIYIAWVDVLQTYALLGFLTTVSFEDSAARGSLSGGTLLFVAGRLQPNRVRLDMGWGR